MNIDSELFVDVDEMVCGACAAFQNEDMTGAGWCATFKRAARCDGTCPHWEARDDD
jgi:hypothetical protein